MAREPYVIGSQAAAFFNEGDLLIPYESGNDVGCKTWLETATADAATLLATNLTSVSYDVSSDFADATTRATAATGFASNVAVLKNGQITFDMVWQPADVAGAAAAPYNFESLVFKKWLEGKFLAMAFMDYPRAQDNPASPSSGAAIYPSGLFGHWSVGMSKTEDLRDVQRASVTLSVSGYAYWYKSDVPIA